MLDRILRYLSSMIFGWLTMLVLATTGCVISLSSLSTQWSNNLLTDPQLEITDPNLTDGNLETVALSVSRQKKDKSRYFVIKFPRTQSVHKIVIYNQNLLLFKVEYLDPKSEKWKVAHSVRTRNFDRDGRLQPKFVIDRLRLNTKMIRINVNRTIDDRIISKVVVDPDDHVVNVIQRSFAGRYAKFFRVLAPSPAAIREIEAYQLVEKSS